LEPERLPNYQCPDFGDCDAHIDASSFELESDFLHHDGTARPGSGACHVESFSVLPLPSSPVCDHDYVDPRPARGLNDSIDPSHDGDTDSSSTSAALQVNPSHSVASAHAGSKPQSALVSFATVNAKFLLTRNAVKAVKLLDLLRDLHFPDIVVVTELAKAAGVKATDWLVDQDGSPVDAYQAFWSCRAISKIGDAADSSRLVGGGVMLLVHRRLQAEIRLVSLEVPDDDRDKIKGHLCVWRLDPKVDIDSSAGRRRLQNPLIISAAYIPPESSSWYDLVAESVFDALEESEHTLLEARRTQQVDHVVIGHFNAHCSTLPVELILSDGIARLHQLREFSASPTNSSGLRARLEVRGERIFLHRRVCRAASSVNAAGRRLVDLMQRSGMCPTSGVLGECMPTTWQNCDPDCQFRQSPSSLCSAHAKLKNVNDLIFVDADQVVDALLHPARSGHAQSGNFRLVSRVMPWAEPIDHAVTYGHFRVRAGAPAASVASSDESKRQRKRMHLPENKHHRRNVQNRTAELLHANLQPADFYPELTQAALSARDDAFVSAAREALSSSLQENQQKPLKANYSETAELTWRQSWRRAWQNRRSAQQSCSDKRFEGPSDLAKANKEIRALLKKRQQHDRLLTSRSISQSVTSAPKLHWKLLKHNAQDPGEPADSRCKLLNRLNDKNGKLLSTDREQIKRLLQEHRKTVFSIRSDLSDAALESLWSDHQLVHFVNDSILQSADGSELSPVSSVANSAREPLQSWKGKQALLPGCMDDVFECFGRVEDKRRAVAGDCAELEKFFSMNELELVLSDLDDTGAGIDGVALAALSRLEHSSKEWILSLFNDVWRTGLLPDSWADIRVVLHYKGKGSDPFCADNYRGLGIGAALEKIVSLMMMRRLETFLLNTNALHPSQGGFLSQRGPPEQVFSLSEVVRAELKRATGNSKTKHPTDPVHMCFIDIERAYDSVQHTKLWARCAEMGIGGRFLSVLQAMYAGKKAVLDVDGELLEPQDIECGVLQGNPLSPLLFNIYIDSVLRDIDRFALNMDELRPGVPSVGIPLPFFDRSGAEVDAPVGTAALLVSLFFADDGVLLARNRVSMQMLLDRVIVALDLICLSLNARKTKIMIVPPLSASDAVYERLKSDVQAAGGYSACGRNIEVVDEFMYLGVCLSYVWDWKRAWQNARLRARRMFYCIRQAGMQTQATPLVYQLRYAASQVISHLDYVAALAGVEGNDGEIDKCDAAIDQLLRFVTCAPLSACGDALKAEAGTWKFNMRVRMLQLRLFAKLTQLDVNSTHFRAMCLSRYHCNRLRHGGRSSLFTWFDGVCSSADYFDFPIQPNLPASSPLRLAHSSYDLLHPILSLVCVERCTDLAVGLWLPVDPTSADTMGQRLRSRAMHEGAIRFDYATGDRVSNWMFPSGTTVANAWSRWTPQLREAAFAELRLRGNLARDLEFQGALRIWASPTSGLRDFAPLKPASYLEPYWFADDPISARCVLFDRIGCSRLEYNYRRAFHHYPRERRAGSVAGWRPSRRKSLLVRIQPEQRACYMCPTDSWMPETACHLLVSCPAPAYDVERGVLRDKLQSIIRKVETIPGVPPSPNLDHAGSLYFAIQLATGVGIIDHRASPPLLAGSDSVVGTITQRRLAHWLPLQQQPNELQRVAKWVSHLSSAWRAAIATEGEHEPVALAGAELVNLVANFHRRMSSVRHRHMQKSHDYMNRLRDPSS